MPTNVAPGAVHPEADSPSRELAHYFLADHRRAVMAGKLGARFSRPEFAWDPTFEKEADVFAANLLMPAAWFRQSMNHAPAGLKGVGALASTYGTSWVAAAYRAVELDLFPAPCAVFQWNEFGDSAGRKMSPVTFLLGLPDAGTIPRPPAGSVTARAIARLLREPMQRVSKETEWFPQLDRTDDFYGVELREEVMALASYGWLTLVWQNPAEDRADAALAAVWDGSCS